MPSSSSRSSATTSSWPSSSAAQLAAITLAGTRQPSTLTRAPAVTSITRPLHQSPTSAWPADQAAPPCPWATPSYHHPTPTFHSSQAYYANGAMTLPSSSSASQGTDYGAATATRFSPEDPWSSYCYTEYSTPSPISYAPLSVDGATTTVPSSYWSSATATGSHCESAQPTTGGGSSSVRPPWGSNVARAGPDNRIYMYYGHPVVPAAVDPAAIIAPQQVVHLQQQQQRQQAAMWNTLQIQGYYYPSQVLLGSASSTPFYFDHYQAMPSITKGATTTTDDRATSNCYLPHHDPSLDGLMMSIYKDPSRWSSATATATTSHHESAQPTRGGNIMYGHPGVPAVDPAEKISPQELHLQQQQPGAMWNTVPIQGYYPSQVLPESASSTRFGIDHCETMPNITKGTEQTQMRSSPGRRRVSRRWRPFMCLGCEVSC